MHKDVLVWAKQALPLEGKVLEVGSLNVNGSLREVLPITHGIDIREGKDVDEVLDACALLSVYGPEYWDHVVSSSTFEHVEFWETALRNAWGALKTGGKFLFEVPTLDKAYHAHPADYWRWDIPLLEQIFGKQDIISLTETWEHGVGVICRKVCDLTYVEPQKVSTKRKKK